MCNSVAIHLSATAVSARKRRAIRIFRTSPCARPANSAPVQSSLSSIRLAAVAAIHDMVNRAGILDAQRAGHDLVLLRAGICVKSTERPVRRATKPLVTRQAHTSSFHGARMDRVRMALAASSFSKRSAFGSQRSLRPCLIAMLAR